jgi:bifunctional non-homologous end joining protein LigD
MRKQLFDYPRNEKTPPLWSQRRFVVKEHHATRLHWDLRLEIAGVLKSLVLLVPPCRDPRAVQQVTQVGDHSLKWLLREGPIPPGKYGAGELWIWDKGMYFIHAPSPLEAWLHGELLLTFYGTQMYGNYRLARMPGSRKLWLLEKCDDEYGELGHTAPIIGKGGPRPPAAPAAAQLALEFPEFTMYAAGGNPLAKPHQRRRH